MSLILDALRKLEQEEAARKDGRMNIAAEILRTELPQPRHKQMVFLTLATLAIGLAVVVALAVRGVTTVPKPSPSPVSDIPPAVPGAVMPAPAPPTPLLQKPEELPSAPFPTDITNREAPLEMPAATGALPAAAVAHPRPADDAVKPPAHRAGLPGKESSSSSRPLTPPTRRDLQGGLPANSGADTPRHSSEGSALRLRVAGIVWQEERAARRAFVNGLMAAEGSVIDGARIVEIYPDRIRFSRDGKTVDVSIDKAP